MGNPLHILFIVPRFATVNRGVETFAFELISRLDSSQFAITVLSGPHATIVPGVAFATAPLLARERLAWLDRMPRLIRCLRPLGVGGASDLETLSLLRNYRKHLHGDAFDVVVPLGGRWTYRFARKVFPAAHVVSIGQAGPVPQDLSRSDVFVALTPHDEARAQQMRPGMPCCVIPNGVDTDRFSPSTFSASLTRHSDRTILCAAALVPDKRHDLLFDAVMHLPDNVSVRCVGAGPHRTVLERHPLVRAGRVEFRQYSFTEMPEVYRNADVFSLASPDEAFGIVFVEAMASGLAVVAHNGPRQQFVVGDGGVLLNVNDPVAYAEALKSVLDDAPSSPARKQASNFDWRQVVPAYTKLFIDLCPGRL